MASPFFDTLPTSIAVSHAPWSISKANVAHECTLRFHLRYTKKATGRHVESSAGRIGTAVHDIIDRMLRGENYPSAFKSAAIKNLTRPEILELKTHERGILRFMAMFADWRARQGRPEVYSELQAAITEDKTATGYWDADCYFRGVMDISAVVTKVDDKFAVVIDHKTGQVSDIAKYQEQLEAYVVFAAIIYPDVSGAQAAIHWIQAEEALEQKPIVWAPMYRRDVIENVIAPRVFARLRSAEELSRGRPTPTEGWYCDFCEYRDSCPIK